MFSFWGLLLVIVATLYEALMYNNETIMLLVYMEAALFVISFFSLLLRRLKLEADLEIPVGLAENGGEGMIKLSVINEGQAPITRMKALLIIKDVARGKRKRRWVTLPVIPGGTSENENKYEFIRNIRFYGTGKYIVVLKKVRFYDMTGLFHWNMRVKKEAQIQVLPKLYDMPVQVTAATKYFYGESDVYDEHSPGYDNTELFQIRTYQRGDRVQSIHWKLSAKQEEIVVKEQALPKVCPVILFLDFTPVGKGKKAKRQLSFIDAVASISYSMMDNGCAHFVVWYDRDKMDVERIRVDDEESLFYFIGTLMKIKWIKPEEDLKQRYKDKYHSEPYVWAFSVDEKLQLKREDKLLMKLSEKNLKKSLSQIELTL